MKKGVKNFLLRLVADQNGQMINSIIFMAVIVGASYMALGYKEISEKKILELKKKIELNESASRVLNNLRRVLASPLFATGSSGCPDLKAFRNIGTGLVNPPPLKLNFGQIKTYGCLITPKDLQNLGDLTVEISPVGLPDLKMLTRNLKISMELRSAEGHVQLKKTFELKMTVFSLAFFNLILNPPPALSSGTAPLFSLPDGEAKVFVHGKTFLAPSDPSFSVNLSLLTENSDLNLSDQVFYLSSVYTKMKKLKVGEGTFSYSRFREIFSQGLVNNYLPSEVVLTLPIEDNPGNWNLRYDYYYFYQKKKFVLPELSDPMVQSATPLEEGLGVFTSTRANANQVGGTGNALLNVLGGEGTEPPHKIQETCISTLYGNQTFVYTRTNADLTLNFEGTTWSGTGDNMPVFCGLVRAKKLIIKTGDDPTQNVALFGVFVISDGLTVEGKGKVHFYNPLDQMPLQSPIKLPGGTGQETLIKAFSSVAASTGWNFFLPVFTGNVSAARSEFRPKKQDNNFGFTHCPPSSPPNVKCWAQVVEKPKNEWLYSDPFPDNLFYLVEYQL